MLALQLKIIMLNKILGSNFSKLVKSDCTWSFVFDGCVVSTDDSWRLFKFEEMVISASDEGQNFCLTSPYDIPSLVSECLLGKPIDSYSFRYKFADLAIMIGGDFALEFVQTSLGYESWSVLIDNTNYICLGGGRDIACISR